MNRLESCADRSTYDCTILAHRFECMDVCLFNFSWSVCICSIKYFLHTKFHRFYLYIIWTWMYLYIVWYIVNVNVYIACACAVIECELCRQLLSPISQYILKQKQKIYNILHIIIFIELCNLHITRRTYMYEYEYIRVFILWFRHAAKFYIWILFRVILSTFFLRF